MLKKLPVLVISVAGVIVIAGAVVGGLVLFKGTTKPEVAKTTNLSSVDSDPALADPTKQESQTKPDLSKDLGACLLVTKDTVVSAVGKKVTTVANAVNRGFAHDSNGTGLQSCTFAFSDADAVNDRLNVTVTLFENEATLKASKDVYVDIAKVSNLGEVAYITSTTSEAAAATPAQHDYNLFVFSGMKLYTFTISQPASDDAFTASTAQAALVSVASTAKF